MPFSSGSSGGNIAPMSPSAAAPSSASISACVITSPSEWPASPRGESNATPPRTSGTPGSRACASTPVPIRSSDTKYPRKVVEALDAQGGRWRFVQVAPGPAADVHRDHAHGERRLDIVVDAISDVRDLRDGPLCLGHDALEERGGRLLDAPARRRADEVDVLAQEVLGLHGCVANCSHRETVRSKQPQRGERVAVEAAARPGCRRTLHAEDVPDVRVRVAARGQAPEDAHEREAWNAGRVRRALPQRRLVEERLADVEDDGLHSHDATSSRSSGDVTFSSRRSPATALIRPPCASTSEAQSVPSPAAARRSASARNACGVCETTRPSRSRVWSSSSWRTRFTVSANFRTGTAPS